MESKKAEFSGIKPFDMTVYLCKDAKPQYDKRTQSHIHDVCEIYVNISGDVSFMVENKVFAIKHGDVIITRPYEYHHCIYNSETAHNHFWITFSHHGNEKLLGAFFERKAGEGNYISLSGIKKEKLLTFCENLLNEQSEIKKHITFLNILDLISEKGEITTQQNLPEDVQLCINYISENLSNPITVKMLAELTHVTVNTLERHFKTYIGISPYAYIQNYRLARAALSLEEGESVTMAAEKNGFSDYSHFISLFRKVYGKTPLQYKKGL